MQRGTILAVDDAHAYVGQQPDLVVLDVQLPDLLGCEVAHLASHDLQAPLRTTSSGLRMLESIIARHGGQVAVESKVGSASRFWSTLPCTLVPTQQQRAVP